MAILGVRGTGEFDVDHRPKNYRELFTLLEPNGTAPLQALLAMTNSESTDDPEYKHFRDELPDRVLTVNNGAGYASGATSIVVDNVADLGFVMNGTMIQVPRTGEVLQVTNVSGTTLTVTRGIGGGAAALVDNDEITIAGFADQEGGTSPDPISWDATVDYNYTQIFKTAVSVTDTLKNTHLRTGDKEQEALTKALKVHMSDIERAMFFGKRAEVNGSSSTPTRYTGGLLSQITNVSDAASAFATANVITEKEFDRLLVETLFAYGSTEKIMFAGPKVVANFQEIAKSRWQPTQVAGSYGVNMSRYSTFAGDLLVLLHPMFRQIPSMADQAIILDLPNVKYRYMASRDTNLQRDIQANDYDGCKHQYLTECGLEMLQSKVHHVIKGWQAVS